MNAQSGSRAVARGPARIAWISPLLVLVPWLEAQSITEVVDATGDGINRLLGPLDVHVDGGSVYVVGWQSDNAFVVDPAGQVRLLIDGNGDGQGHLLRSPRAITTDSHGTVYVAGGESDNVFSISVAGSITQVLDSSGDGMGNDLDDPFDLAVDSEDNLYVAGRISNNVLRLNAAGLVEEIINASGDGVALLQEPVSLAIDSADSVYVTGTASFNAFRIRQDGTISEIITGEGDGQDSLGSAWGVAVDGLDNIYVGSSFANVFRIAPTGGIEAILRQAGDGMGNPVKGTTALAADGSGNCYVAGFLTDNLFRVSLDNTVVQVVSAIGSSGAEFDGAFGVAADQLGTVYVTGAESNNVLRLEACSPVQSSAVVQNGSGVNPLVFASVTLPSIGTTWRAVVDIQSLGFELSAVALASRGVAGIPTPSGELLCSRPVFSVDVSLGEHNIVIPYDCSLLGVDVCVQAAAISGIPLELLLCNAIDLHIGVN